jgi:lactose/L-arabinose transport system permease protein
VTNVNKLKYKNVLSYIVLTFASLISIVPMYWMVVSSTNNSVDVTRGVLVPGTAFLENWAKLLKSQPLATSMINSFKYAIVLTLLSLVICSLAGYGFEIYHDKGKDAVMGVILLAMMVPFAATLIPLSRCSHRRIF